MGGDDNDDMGFQHRNENAMGGGGKNALPQKVSGMPMNTMSMYKPASAADHFFGSGWDPIVSLNQGENFGLFSMVSCNEFATSYPVALENQGISSTSNLDRYSPDPSFVELVPKIPCFGSGNLSEMVRSFGLPENVPNKEECNGKTRKRAPESNFLLHPCKNAEVELQRDPTGDSSGILKEQDEKKQKIEQNTGANMRGKQAAKQAKDGSNSGEAHEEYIHMRAKRGQATNRHSLAERVRREKISERMKLLQELVPGCNKITGKAVMLDQIINYVQSLQRQVEFFSMKLATVNPELNIDRERILSKEILHSCSSSAAIIGCSSGMNSSRPYSPGIFQGTMPTIPSANPQFPPLPQAVLDHEFQSLFQMGYDSTSAVDSLGPNTGHSKSEL